MADNEHMFAPLGKEIPENPGNSGRTRKDTVWYKHFRRVVETVEKDTWVIVWKGSKTTARVYRNNFRIGKLNHPAGHLFDVAVLTQHDMPDLADNEGVVVIKYMGPDPKAERRDVLVPYDPTPYWLKLDPAAFGSYLVFLASRDEPVYNEIQRWEEHNGVRLDLDAIGLNEDLRYEKTQPDEDDDDDANDQLPAPAALPTAPEVEVAHVGAEPDGAPTPTPGVQDGAGGAQADGAGPVDGGSVPAVPGQQAPEGDAQVAPRAPTIVSPEGGVVVAGPSEPVRECPDAPIGSNLRARVVVPASGCAARLSLVRPAAAEHRSPTAGGRSRSRSGDRSARGPHDRRDHRRGWPGAARRSPHRGPGGLLLVIKNTGDAFDMLGGAVVGLLIYFGLIWLVNKVPK